MKQYIKHNNEINDVQIIDKYEYFDISNEIMSFCNFDNIIENCTFKNINIDSNKIGIKFSSIDQVITLYNTPIFKNIQIMLINYNMIDDEEIHFLFFIGKKIFVFDDNINNDTNYQKILLNPLISGLCNVTD